MRDAGCVIRTSRHLSLELGLSPLCRVQHPLAEIQGRHVRAVPGQRLGEVARATAEVQRPLPGCRSGQADHAPLPVPVEPEALEVIDQVVTRRDPGKEILHLGGALVAWIKERVGHR